MSAPIIRHLNRCADHLKQCCLWHISKRNVNIPIVWSPFERKDRVYPWDHKHMSLEKMEKKYEEINDVRNMEITEPSPLHLVYRYKKISGTRWQQKVILKRLGLHCADSEMPDPQILPNTPEINRMLWEVKHLIRLAPVTFPNGIPTEKDIGAVRFNCYNGEMEINERFRISEQDLEKAKTPILFGKYLQEYLKWASNIHKG